MVQTPSHISPPTPFNLSLARSSRPTDVRLFDGGRYAWLVCGGILFVVATDTGKCISRLQLTVTRDEPYSVSSSCELKHCAPGARGRKPSCLLVLAVDYEGRNPRRSVLVVFNPTSCQLVRAVAVPCRVTSLCAVCGGGFGTPGLFSQSPLQCFSGALAVGCVGGRVLLVDLALGSSEAPRALLSDPGELVVLKRLAREGSGAVVSRVRQAREAGRHATVDITGRCGREGGTIHW